MVNITKVYTRTGDKGDTQLAAGKAISKNSVRIQAIGEIDELNAFLGWVNEVLLNTELHNKILRIQNEIFNLGAQLSVLSVDRRFDTPCIESKNIKILEEEIDAMNSSLSSLQSFILPGGGETATRLHIARTVCRRAERAIVTLAEQEKLDGTEIPYLNRLSDWLFVAARFMTAKSGKIEHLWQPKD